MDTFSLHDILTHETKNGAVPEQKKKSQRYENNDINIILII